jgi:hypothetical protein
MPFGLTADIDNAALTPALLEPFMMALDRPLEWRAPDAAELGAFAMRGDLKRNGDNLYAVCDGFAGGAWALKNMWSGFPDPAEFVFLSFNANGQLFAKGYFDDWPEGWTRETT